MKKFNYDYDKYISTQKGHEKTKGRTKQRTARRKDDIALIKEVFPKSKKVLCIGCRDISEIKDFEKTGFAACGIDLFSNESKIKILDMHEIGSTFKDNEFDIVYMSHSLEHSYHPEKVLSGIEKVCKDGLFVCLPFVNEPTKKDPIVFSCMNKPSIDNIKEEFSNFLQRKFEILNLGTRERKGDLSKEFFFLLKFVNEE